MLYQAVRPTKLEEVRGNGPTIKLLNQVLRKPADKRPHAFLLWGPSGCGKTTLARIMCKAFECTDIDIFELNAANTRGIDTVRELAQKAAMCPLGGKAKAYILDESHQLTPAAQEALLKILEDTPAHCYFFLCTTEPEAIIKTILNRCTRYEVNRLGQQDIYDVLMDACDKTKITVVDEILVAIIENCEGSPRRALVALEQIQGIDNAGEAIKIIQTGTDKDAQIIDLCKLLYLRPDKRHAEWQRILKIFDAIDDDPEKIRRAIMGFFYKKLLQADTEAEAREYTLLLRTFSVSVYYGGKAQLGALVARACFESQPSE